uniref:Putative secreted protein n=1 Tax=Amblyomma americanum TaxID=6943 RepID=A0A0C9SEG6_AMBAM
MKSTALFASVLWALIVASECQPRPPPGRQCPLWVLVGLFQVQPPVFCLPGLSAVIADINNDLLARADVTSVNRIIEPAARISAHAPTSGTAEHVVHQAFKRSPASALFFSGLGSSASETMFRSHFCFILQFLVGLFQVQPPVFCLPGLSAVIADINNDLLARADVTSVNRIIEPAARISAHAPTSGTAEHVVHQAFKRSPASAFIFSGLGSSASETMFRSHFCFILQCAPGALPGSQCAPGCSCGQRPNLIHRHLLPCNPSPLAGGRSPSPPRRRPSTNANVAAG